MIKNDNDETMEYGESMIFMSGTQPEQETRQILDEIDKLLAKVGIDDKYTAVSQKPATSKTYNPKTDETTLRKIEYGESMIFMSGTQPEQETRQILDEIDKLLAKVGIDDKYTAVSQKPATSKTYNPKTDETTLRKIEHGDIGIGIERIN
jgi:enamine deaminase RidA (YjgF/YER057c/UK114 family)